jgi:hypothetical protein
MNKETIKCNDDNFYDIVESQIELLGNQADLNHLDVSSVTNMKKLFWGEDFNGSISEWDVSNVTDMERMFSESTLNLS